MIPTFLVKMYVSQNTGQTDYKKETLKKERKEKKAKTRAV